MAVKTCRYIWRITLFLTSSLLASGIFAGGNTEGIQVYQKSTHLSPTHKQKLAADIFRYRNADNIWDVLREQFSMPHYERNPYVQERIQWYMNHQDFLLRAASRAAPYLFYISEQVKKRHLPAELVLLPIIESAYNPFAISHVGASGLWQMMPQTATGYGIHQDASFDGRRDVIASTSGALNYLAYLENFFEGNWLRAVAAYNTGEGNVLAAIKRNIRAGRPTDFWSLPLAQETRSFVPSLLALATIISHPEKYQVYFPPIRNAPYLAQIDIGKQINLKYAATLAGMSYEKLSHLNPGFNRLITSKQAPYKLVLPIEKVELFWENWVRSPLNTQLKWIHYQVRRGETLASLAKKYKTTPAAITTLNHLEGNEIKAGLNLLIPHQSETLKILSTIDSATNQPFKPLQKISSLDKNADAINPAELKEQMKASPKYLLQPGDTIYMIRNQDTADSIANRFHIDKQDLIAANAIKGNKLTPGLQIIIPTHKKIKAEMPVGNIIYVVKKGDTLEKIALRFHLTPAEIRVANLTDKKNFQEGESLIIPTHIQALHS